MDELKERAEVYDVVRWRVRRLSQISAILLGLFVPICASANGELAAKLLNGSEVVKQCHYPPKALQAHAEGETLLSLVIDDTGKLSNIDVKQSSGSEELDNCGSRVHEEGAVSAGDP